MVIAAAAGILTIGKRIRVIAEWVTLRPYILLQVGVLIRGKVSVKKKSVIVRAEIVQV